MSVHVVGVFLSYNLDSRDDNIDIFAIVTHESV